MEMFIKSTQYQLWRIITRGHIEITKLENEYTQEDYNILQHNTKARYILTCSLSRIEYNKF
uniref:Uncharacterized protein n=1 Tax=Cajanus cajan TaxID=3821 RepID=A0A151UEH5_CAJCA